MNAEWPRSSGRCEARKSRESGGAGEQQRRSEPHAGGRWGRYYRHLVSLPGLDYLMIRIVVFLLTGIGVVMVFSSTMASSVVEGGTAWSTAVRQGVMVVAGLCVFWLALKVRPGKIQKIAPWLLGITFVTMIAVLTPLGVGREEVGAQSWLVLGPIQLQPAEISKVAIGLWGAVVLAGNSYQGRGWENPFIKFSLVATALTLLNLLQGDLGTTLNLVLMVVALLIFAGVRLQWVWGMFIAALIGSAVMVLTGRGFRSDRVEVFFNSLFGKFEDTQGRAFQSYQGFLSLADGSISGVGLGQSRAKWFYLPEAQNDFIFAIVGEELGLWGGTLVIILFCLLGVFGLRTAIRAQDQFQSLLAATLTAGIVSQAFINIGYVIGLLPVTGIQLPMISSGGTSAIITLGSMGLLANCARHEPEAVSAMQSYGRPLFDRVLFIAEPRPADDSATRQRLTAKPRFGAPVARRSPRSNSVAGSIPEAPRRSADFTESERSRLNPQPHDQLSPQVQRYQRRHGKRR